MGKFKYKFDAASVKHDEALAKIKEKYKDIKDDSIFNEDHYGIVKMIPDPLEQLNYCHLVIDLYDSNIDYLYELYILKEYRNKHINIVLISLVISGVAAIFGGLPAALISGGISYAFFSKKDLQQYTNDMKHHNWQLDSIVDLQREIKKLEKLLII